MRHLSALFLVFIFSLQSFAQFSEGTFELIVKKKEQKELNRWSLAEWLDTKQRFKLMDMWLALHTSDNTYEFFLGYQKNTFDRELNQGGPTVKEGFNEELISFDAFASIVGLNYKNFTSTEGVTGWQGEFLLRVLGTSNQNTNLTLSYGVKNRVDKSVLNLQNYENNFYKISLTLYFIKHFGLLMSQTSLIEKTNSAAVKVSGSSTQYQLFIDYGIVRIFGGAYTEKQDYAGGTTSTIARTGTYAGLKLFF